MRKATVDPVRNEQPMTASQDQFNPHLWYCHVFLKYLFNSFDPRLQATASGNPNWRDPKLPSPGLFFCLTMHLFPNSHTMTDWIGFCLQRTHAHAVQSFLSALPFRDLLVHDNASGPPFQIRTLKYKQRRNVLARGSRSSVESLFAAAAATRDNLTTKAEISALPLRLGATHVLSKEQPGPLLPDTG